MADEATTTEPSPLDLLAARYDTGDRDQHTPPQPAPPVPVAPPAASPSAPPAGKDTKPAHPPSLRNMALELGLDPADVDAAPTDQLAAFVHGTVRQMRLDQMAARRADNQLAALRPDQQPAHAAGHQPPAEVDPLDEVEAEDEDFDPRLTKRLKALAAETRELRKLKDQIGGVVQREQQREFTSKVDLVDAAFAALKADTLLGAGGRKDIVKDSPEFKRRVAVLNAAGLQLSGVPLDQMPSLVALTAKLKAAYTDLFGSAPAHAAGHAEDDDPYGSEEAGTQPAEEPIPPRQLPPRNGAGKFTRTQWNGAAVRRPTHRTGGGGETDQERTARAVAAVAALQKATGTGPGSPN